MNFLKTQLKHHLVNKVIYYFQPEQSFAFFIVAAAFHCFSFIQVCVQQFPVTQN